MVSIRYKILACGAAILLAVLAACSAGSTSTPLIPAVPTIAAIPVVPAATNTATAVPATAAPASSSLPVAASPAIQSLDMLDVNNGWALTDTAVIRTTDGGATWLTASPSSLSGSPSSTFFLDASTAWLAVMGADPTTGTLFHTTRWRRHLELGGSPLWGRFAQVRGCDARLGIGGIERRHEP